MGIMGAEENDGSNGNDGIVPITPIDPIIPQKIAATAKICRTTQNKRKRLLNNANKICLCLENSYICHIHFNYRRLIFFTL